MGIHHLVSFSGGFDSTCAVFLQLQEGSMPVHIHHINLINRERRDIAERLAIVDILDWLRDSYTFTYSESVCDVRQDSKRFMSYDYRYYLPILCGVALNMPCKRVVLNLGIVGSSGPAYKPGGIPYEFIKNCYFLYRKEHLIKLTPDIMCPTLVGSKKKLLTLIPPELARLTHSCRMPYFKNTKWLNCGKCRTCKEMKLTRGSFRNTDFVTAFLE